MKFKSIKIKEDTYNRLIQDIATEMSRETMDDAVNRMLDHTYAVRAIIRNTYVRK